MVTQPFKQAVDNKDIKRIKIMLRSSLSTDLTFAKFKDMLSYTLDRIPTIIENHDGKEFLGKSSWTKDYASEVREDLMNNFSAERIEKIKEIHEYIYANELKSQKNDIATSEHREKEIAFDSKVISLITTLGVGIASILVGVLMNLSIVQVATTSVIASGVVGGVTYYLVKKTK